MVRLQGEEERRKGIYFEYNPDDTPLGEGGMGKVIKGYCCNERTGQRRDVAIKFLYSDLPPHVIARARREAAVRLRNDSLVEMLGFIELSGRDEVGHQVSRYHVVSEYLHGVTLDQLLEGRVTDVWGNVIPFAQELYGKHLSDPYHFALIVIRDLLAGLMALHDAGYIHRDIDPSNIMITSDGKVKLIDFGISKKVAGKDTKESEYTALGQFIGKPKYAAPELARGLVDAQGNTTDLYAVGILLYQLVVGQVPFDGEMAEVLEMQLTKNVPLRPLLSKQLRQVVRKATQKKRELRYQSAAEFRVAIEGLMPLAYPQKTIDWKPWIGIGSAAAAALMLVALLNGLTGGGDAPLPPAPQEAEAPAVAATPTYADAVKMLNSPDPATADRGLTELKALAEGNDDKALFLLSRLYFDGTQDVQVDRSQDEARRLRGKKLLQPDNAQAHRLLSAAVAANDRDYHYLFELGCDFKSGRRGVERDEQQARFYFERARTEAEKAGDTEYVKAIDERMSNL